MVRKFIIDTDTASDDAVALIMALRWVDVEVEAITVVSGNVTVDQATRNALYVTDLCGKATPVYKGAPKPLLRPTAHAEWFHGKDGLGDIGYPPPTRQPEVKHAVDGMIDTIRANPGIVLVTLGPLTNVALALGKAPDIAANVSRCVIMGGAACTSGNVTPAAEYNIWCDPEAADIVFRSGLPIEMVGWELCRGQANLLPEEIALIRGFGTDLAVFSMDCNRRAHQATQEQSGDPGLGLPDPVAMSIALDPSICTASSAHHIAVETAGVYTRGMTIVDRFGVAPDVRNAAIWEPYLRGPQAGQGEPKTRVCWQIDIARWKEALYSVLR
ncbi:MAG: nucleoside hydrolase [Anaerolineae bacterium]|nr:nucleoside hydrolase [Anaerolineae bacterium]NUQ05870.1 nucleoside hydrolase [Anaerolineae bacterium]